MNYEQKYYKMLDDARYQHDVSEGDIPAVLEEIFPELKESESEKVRKEILEVAKTVVLRDGTLYGKKYNCREWIAWLEKQGKEPQSHWKPSEEQIKALHDMNLTGNISYAGQGQVLIELYNDLKKL